LGRGFETELLLKQDAIRPNSRVKCVVLKHDGKRLFLSGNATGEKADY
jgi:hypothetical protein